jgi:hypothetical protein
MYIELKIWDKSYQIWYSFEEWSEWFYVVWDFTEWLEWFLSNWEKQRCCTLWKPREQEYLWEWIKYEYPLIFQNNNE